MRTLLLDWRLVANPRLCTRQLAQVGQRLRDLLREARRIAAAEVDHLLRDTLLEVRAALVEQLRAGRAVPPELERAPDLRCVTADGRARLVELLAELAHPRRVAAGGVPHVGVARDEPERGLARGADPERRMRLLHRLRVRDGVLHAVVPAVEVRPLLGPE